MVLLLASVAIASFAQEKITGFGRLQLGMLVQDIPELSNPKFINGTSEYFSKVYKNTSDNVYEAQIDTLKPSSNFVTISTNQRIFHVGRIKLTDNITIKDVTLKFYNDKLYSIECGDSQIDDLLTSKYGEGKVETETKDHTFQNGYGAKFVKTDLKKEITWNTNDAQIKCYYIDNYFYGSDGKLLHYEFASLSNKATENSIHEEFKSVVARVSKRDADKKKELVSGF